MSFEMRIPDDTITQLGIDAEYNEGYLTLTIKHYSPYGDDDEICFSPKQLVILVLMLKKEGLCR